MLYYYYLHYWIIIIDVLICEQHFNAVVGTELFNQCGCVMFYLKSKSAK